MIFWKYFLTGYHSVVYNLDTVSPLYCKNTTEGASIIVFWGYIKIHSYFCDIHKRLVLWECYTFFYIRIRRQIRFNTIFITSFFHFGNEANIFIGRFRRYLHVYFLHLELLLISVRWLSSNMICFCKRNLKKCRWS